MRAILPRRSFTTACTGDHFASGLRITTMRPVFVPDDPPPEPPTVDVYRTRNVTVALHYAGELLLLTTPCPIRRSLCRSLVMFPCRCPHPE